jgi:RNA polymerase sigma-70 factor (ECF subfamily)
MPPIGDPQRPADQAEDASNQSSDMGRWIQAARRGDRESLGELFAQCRGYLLAIAHAELDETLRGKLAVSDVVQETLLRVQQNFAGFRGTAEAELLAWLRQVLANYLKDVRRSFRRTGKRNIEREKHGRYGPNKSAFGLADVAVDSVTPGRTVADLEETERLRAALAGLPDEYRTVLALRTWERLSFEEVGKRMGRSADAARMLWTRAVKKLTAELRNVSDELP